MSTFVMRDTVRQETFEWGTVGWRLVPSLGSRHLVVMDVIIAPGVGHDFHRHPGQEEMIIVREGQITQFIEQESSLLASGDSAFLEAGIIHASIGRVSFTPEKLVENGQELINAIVKAKPATAKGTYLKSLFMASSMSPGIAIDTKAFAH